MRYAGLINEDLENGPGFGVSLFIQGCPHKCENCFNPETWSFDGGEEFTDDVHLQILEMIKKPYITRFSLLGGEPFGDKNNFITILNLLVDITTVRPDIKIWCWTGYFFTELSFKMVKEYPELQGILDKIDYIIDGKFIQEEKDISLKYRGSRNQQIYHQTSFQEWSNVTDQIDPVK